MVNAPDVAARHSMPGRNVRRTATALTLVAAGLALLVLVVVGHGGKGSVQLDTASQQTAPSIQAAGGAPAAPARPAASAAAAAAPIEVRVPVGVPVAVGIPRPVLVPVPVAVRGGQSSSGGGVSAAPRVANGPAAPHVDRFYADPDNAQTDQTIEFHWWAGDEDGLIRAYAVDFGDGAKDGQMLADRCQANPSDPVAERTPFRHAYTNPGQYTVRLKAYSSGACNNGPWQTVEQALTVNVTITGTVL